MRNGIIILFLVLAGQVSGQSAGKADTARYSTSEIKEIFGGNTRFEVDSIYESKLDGLIDRNETDSAYRMILRGIAQASGIYLYDYLSVELFFPFTSPKYRQVLWLADSVLDKDKSPADAVLAKRLRHVYLDDQRYRRKMAFIVRQPGFFNDSLLDAEFRSCARKMQEQDKISTDFIDSLYSNGFRRTLYHCPYEVVACRAFTVVVLHADNNPEFQWKIIGHHRKRNLKYFGKEAYSVIYDRCMINRKKMPKYYSYAPQGYKISDYKKVNRARKKIGLPAIKPEP